MTEKRAGPSIIAGNHRHRSAASDWRCHCKCNAPFLRRVWHALNGDVESPHHAFSAFAEYVRKLRGEVLNGEVLDIIGNHVSVLRLSSRIASKRFCGLFLLLFRLPTQRTASVRSRPIGRAAHFAAQAVCLAAVFGVILSVFVVPVHWFIG